MVVRGQPNVLAEERHLLLDVRRVISILMWTFVGLQSRSRLLQRIICCPCDIWYVTYGVKVTAGQPVSKRSGKNVCVLTSPRFTGSCISRGQSHRPALTTLAQALQTCSTKAWCCILFPWTSADHGRLMFTTATNAVLILSFMLSCRRHVNALLTWWSEGGRPGLREDKCCLPSAS